MTPATCGYRREPEPGLMAGHRPGGQISLDLPASAGVVVFRRASPNCGTWRGIRSWGSPSRLERIVTAIEDGYRAYDKTLETR